jgi:hypothetical protein
MFDRIIDRIFAPPTVVLLCLGVFLFKDDSLRRETVPSHFNATPVFRHRFTQLC